MLFAVIKTLALCLFFRAYNSVCHLKDMGEVSRNNWTEILQVVENRIIGGSVTNLNQYPFMVQFYNSGGLCGGTVLTGKTVLTAAHCFDHNKNLEEMRIFSNPRFTFDINSRTHEVWNFIIHENYNLKYVFSNDIAVIIIHDKFIFGPQVQKATIIDTDIWMKENEVFVATGWGETKYGTGLKRTELQMIYLHYISKERCMAENEIELGPEVFCLHGDGKRDTCRGDSGGGVLWNGVIVGIVSHGRNCAKLPGMYINVHFFRSWIRLNVKNLYKTFCNFHMNKV